MGLLFVNAMMMAGGSLISSCTDDPTKTVRRALGTLSPSSSGEVVLRRGLEVLCLFLVLLPATVSEGRAQSQCVKSLTTHGSLLKGKSYEVEASFTGVTPAQALGRLTHVLPSQEIDVVAVDEERGLIVGRTNSPNQRPYPVEIHVTGTSSGTHGRLLLSLPLGAFAAPGVAAELCEVLSLIGVATAAETSAAATTPAPAPEAQATPGVCSGADQLITKDAAGKVRLGMTVAEARREFPGATIGTTEDGDGLVTFEVKNGEELLLHLYPDDGSLGESARITAIWVYSNKYATSEGVCPGMPLRDVARLLGGPPTLTMSEIESREYAEFPQQPDGLVFQVTHGSLPFGYRRSTEFTPDAAILNIYIDF